MIKFTTGKLVGFGITKENVERLQEGDPIFIMGEEMGLQHDFLILYGDTQQDIMGILKERGLIPDPQKLN